MMNYRKKTKKNMRKHLQDEHGDMPEAIRSSALNTWIFNEDTIQTSVKYTDDRRN